MNFSTIDYAVLFLYLIGITVFGTLFRRTHKTLRDYFVGSQKTHWLVISVSIVATETSSLTLIGVPALAFTPGGIPEEGAAFTYLQVVFGYVIARVIISYLLLPLYFRGNLLTAYELLANRFGAGTKHFAASLFLVMRAMADGVRTFAAALVVAIVIGNSLPNLPNLGVISIVLVGILTLIYTFEGGIAAVIWTDLIQFVIYCVGSVMAGWLLLDMIPGGWATVQTEAASKFQLFSFSWDLSLPFTFWAGIIGGTFLTMASHGTDQLLVQRLLTCKNLRDSQKALIGSGIIVLAQFALFLAIGVMLYVFYLHHPMPVLQSNDQIFPKFIVDYLPTGMAGLVIAAILAAAMSTLSGSLSSLASSTILDFYRPLFGRHRTDEELLRLSRWCTAAWGVILIGIAVVASGWGSVFTTGLTIASLVYGPMLGAFLLGVLTRRANQRGAMAGLAVSLACMVAIKQFMPALLGWTLAWTWYVLVGTVICMSVGYLVSLAAPNANRADALPAPR